MHVKTSKLALISHMMPSSVLTVVDGGGRAVETAGIKATLYIQYSTVFSPPQSHCAPIPGKDADVAALPF